MFALFLSILAKVGKFWVFVFKDYFSCWSKQKVTLLLNYDIVVRPFLLHHHTLLTSK